MAEPSLSGVRVVLTRSKRGNAAWAKRLAAFGALVYELPTIETVPLILTAEEASVLARLPEFDWLVFTSAAGVRAFSALVPMQTSSLPRIAVIGESTARAAQAAGLTVTFTPSVATGTALAAELPAEEERVLLLRARIAPEDLPIALRRRHTAVTDLPVYDTRIMQERDEVLEQALTAGAVDALTFASPSAVRGFIRRVGQPSRALAYQVPALTLGPATAESAIAAGFADVRVADEPSLSGIVRLLAACARQEG